MGTRRFIQVVNHYQVNIFATEIRNVMLILEWIPEHPQTSPNIPKYLRTSPFDTPTFTVSIYSVALWRCKKTRADTVKAVCAWYENKNSTNNFTKQTNGSKHTPNELRYGADKQIFLAWPNSIGRSLLWDDPDFLANIQCRRRFVHNCYLICIAHLFRSVGFFGEQFKLNEFSCGFKNKKMTSPNIPKHPRDIPKHPQTSPRHPQTSPRPP